MLKKTCPGCGKIINYNTFRCEKCAKKYEEHTKQRHKEYKANRVDVKEQRFYVSKPWLKVRDTIKAKDKGLCKLCLSKGDITYMNTVHHIEELKDCWDKKLDPDNLISLCESCHGKVHKEYSKGELEKKQMQDTLIKLIQGQGVFKKFKITEESPRLHSR